MIVLTGSLKLFGQVYRLRYDSTADRKSYTLFKPSVREYYLNKLSGLSKDDIVFSTLDIKGDKTYVYGDERIASRVMGEIIRATSKLSSNDATKYEKVIDGHILVGREFQSQLDGNYKVGYTVQKELGYLFIDSQVMELEIGRIKGRAQFMALLTEEDYIVMDRLANDIKGTTIALQFPTKDELIAKFGMDWMWDKNGRSKKNYVIVQSEEQLERIIEEYIARANILSLDVESDGLIFCDLPASHPSNNHIVDVIISWQVGQSILIPFDHTEVAYNFDPYKTLKKLEPYLVSKPCVGAHVKFDQRVLKCYDVDINFTEDVLLMWYNMDPMRAKIIPGLKNVLAHYGIKQPSLSEIAKGAETFVRLFPEHLMHCYCCADSDNTLWLYYKLKEEMLPTSVYGYKQDIRVSKYLSDDEYYTTYINVQFLDRAINAALNDKRYLEELLYKQVGQYIMYNAAKQTAEAEGLSPDQVKSLLTEYVHTDEYKSARYEFDPSKDVQVREIMFEIFQLKPLAFTKDKKASVASATIKKYIGMKRTTSMEADEKFSGNVYKSISKSAKYKTKDDILINKKDYEATANTFAYLFSRWKLTNSELTKFFYPLKKMAGDTQGRVCLSFRTTHTETYRLTHRLQTLKGVLKRLVVAPPKTYCFGFDAAAIEYRVVANEAHDEHMIKKLQHPEADYHTEVASVAFNIPPNEITGKQRKEVKPVNFGSIYGISEYGLCTSSLGLEPTTANLKKASDLILTIKQSIPQIFAYLDLCKNLSYEHGCFLNHDKRIRYFDKKNNSRGRVERQALNYPIQSYAAGIFRDIYLNFKDELKASGLYDKVRTYLLVHDELQNYVDETVHPYQICHLVNSKCVISEPNKAPYYLGLGFGMNWYESKDDKAELPVLFLQQKAKEWEDGKWRDHKIPAHEVPNFVYKEMQEWMFNRYYNEIVHYGGYDPTNGTIKSVNLAEYVQSYYIKRRIEHFVEMDTVDKKVNRLHLDYNDIAMLLVVMELTKKSSLTVEGTAITITRDELLSEEFVTQMRSELFLPNTDNKSIFDIFDETDLSITFGDEDDELESTSEDTTDVEELLEMPDSFEYTDYSAAVIYDFDDYSANQFVSPTITRDALGNEKITYEGISTDFKGDSLNNLGYFVVGSILTVKVTPETWKDMLTYFKEIETKIYIDSYEVMFELPNGDTKPLPIRITNPDFDKITSISLPNKNTRKEA